MPQRCAGLVAEDRDAAEEGAAKEGAVGRGARSHECDRAGGAAEAAGAWTWKTLRGGKKESSEEVEVGAGPS